MAERRSISRSARSSARRATSSESARTRSSRDVPITFSWWKTKDSAAAAPRVVRPISSAPTAHADPSEARKVIRYAPPGARISWRSLVDLAATLVPTLAPALRLASVESLSLATRAVAAAPVRTVRACRGAAPRPPAGIGRQLVAVQEAVLVGVGAIHQDLQPIGQLSPAQLAVAVLVERQESAHGLLDVRPRPLAEAAHALEGRVHLLAGQLTVPVLVEGLERRGRILDLPGRELAVAIGVERPHEQERRQAPLETAPALTRPLRPHGRQADREAERAQARGDHPITAVLHRRSLLVEEFPSGGRNPP